MPKCWVARYLFVNVIKHFSVLLTLMANKLERLSLAKRLSYLCYQVKIGAHFKVRYCKVFYTVSALLGNMRLGIKAWHKGRQSNLIVFSISNKEIGFITLTAGANVIKLLSFVIYKCSH